MNDLTAVEIHKLLGTLSLNSHHKKKEKKKISIQPKSQSIWKWVTLLVQRALLIRKKPKQFIIC